MTRLPIFTFSSIKDAPTRRDATTNFIDYWTPVKKGPLTLLSLFGFSTNASTQWIQLFDHDGALTGSITDTDDGTGELTVGANSGIHTGQEVILGSIAGMTRGFAYVNSSTAIQVFDTYDHALKGASGTGIILPSSNGDTGTWTLIPFHTFAAGADNNYSMIIPVTGLTVSFGLCVANSSTEATYTAGAAKDITACGTFLL